MDRNPISDLEAIAAMPGLEVLAEVLAGFVPKGRGAAADPVSILVLLAGRSAFGSANHCDSAFRSTFMWDVVRASAARVGRDLPGKPPTFDKLRHLRRVANDGVADALAAALQEPAVALAKSIGLLDSTKGTWDAPDAGRVIYGDGSCVRPLSSVYEDGNGEVHGSRAGEGGKPRIATTYKSKEGNNGLPINTVGCHGRERWQRVFLGVDMFRDGNEIDSAVSLLEGVITEADGGVSHAVYDMLMSGTHMRAIMKAGALPVCKMKQARQVDSHAVLPEEFRSTGQQPGRSRGTAKGKGPRMSSTPKREPKSRLQRHFVRLAEHTVGARVCVHELWGLDSAVVAVEPGQLPDINVGAYLPTRDIRWEQQSDGWHLFGRYTVPCRHGSFPVEIDFAADRSGKQKGGGPLALADHVRPIPETARGAARILGMRSDVESLFSWLKARLPRERASSLKPDDFLLDVIGAALHNNAIAWDVHHGLHTECARHTARLGHQRALRATV